MHKTLATLGILGGMILLGTARAEEPGRITNPDNAAKTPPAAESLPPGDYVGRLVSVDAKANAVVLRINTQRKVLKNPDGPTQTADQIAREIEKGEVKVGGLMENATYSRSPADYQRKQAEAQKAISQFQQSLPNKLNRLQQQQENPQPVEYVTINEPKDVSLTAIKEVKVRLREAPTIDEDGKVRTYTAEGLLKMKGNEPYLPGYDGKLRNLNPGDYVRVTVVAKAAVKGTEKKAADGLSNLTEVSSIVVISKEQAQQREGARP